VLAVLKVDVVDCVSHVSAPVTRLVALEVGTPALSEAHLRTERLLTSRSLQREQLFAARHLLAPGAHSTARWDARRVCQQKTRPWLHFNSKEGNK
jgi:hypothetical protein